MTTIPTAGLLRELIAKNRTPRNTQLARSIALALGVVTMPMAYAQTATAPAAAAAPAGDAIEEVVVTGIRASLTSSASLKRSAVGVVDGISAEDIGKFPDTNLAESMQRITGVSIDRSNGEGSKVSVRGIGADWNLVLLNGRQMPGANINDTSASNSRAFDFANLASESIAAVEVHKTSSADRATGGLGATINIRTTRPLDRPGRTAAFGVKAVTDRSIQNLPEKFKGSSYTPEVSGIYSDTFADNTFGVAITASYQDRAAGYNQAGVASGYHSILGSDTGAWGTINGAGNTNVVTNPPGPNDIYQVPQDIRYFMTGIERKRINGQLTMQYRPVDSVTATLDYTYSENKIATKRQELSAWFNFGPSISNWTSGPVRGPLSYVETVNCADTLAPDPNTGVLGYAGCADVAMAQSNFATKAKNNSVGFNLKWEASDKLSFEFDAHDSTAINGEDSPLGNSNTLGVSGYFRGTNGVDFSQDFPVLSITLPAGLNGAIDPSLMEVTGSSFRNSYTKAQVRQVQLSGDWKFADRQKLDFGVGLTDVKNRSAYSNVQQNAWGGLGNPTNYPDSAFTADSLRPYFGNIGGSSNSALFNQFFNWDFEAVRAAAIAFWNTTSTGGAAQFSANPVYTDTDRTTKEKSDSAYIQYSTSFDMGRPAHFAAGLRYEKTDVTSPAKVQVPLSSQWVAANEVNISFSQTPVLTNFKGKYSFALPNLDFDVDLTPNLKGRVSWGKSIGRPDWGSIQGGLTIDSLARPEFASGAQGNPALKPLESKNIDLSLEWYYKKGSYLSVGYFKKDVTNYPGFAVLNQTPYSIPNPGLGPWVAEAIAAPVGAGGCPTGDSACVRNYIFANHAGDPAVTLPTNTAQGIIAGRPGIDPDTIFHINTPVNQGSANIKGWELNLQHMFGRSGFGGIVNYTKVTSDLEYNIASLGAQFPLQGLSDTANFVGFYENSKWQARVAYNWRDQFYSGTDGQQSPVFIEPYGQIDANIGFKLNDRLSFQLEAINITDRNTRSHSRTRQAVELATQTGVRYMIGARYQLGK